MNEIAMQVMVAVEDASERSSTDARATSEHGRLRDLVILSLVRARGDPTTSWTLAF